VRRITHPSDNAWALWRMLCAFDSPIPRTSRRSRSVAAATSSRVSYPFRELRGGSPCPHPRALGGRIYPPVSWTQRCGRPNQAKCRRVRVPCRRVGASPRTGRRTLVVDVGLPHEIVTSLHGSGEERRFSVGSVLETSEVFERPSSETSKETESALVCISSQMRRRRRRLGKSSDLTMDTVIPSTVSV